jgi:hypothetical protein
MSQYNTLLLEEIYNRPELLVVDKLFQEILDNCPSDDFKKPIFKNNLNKISKIMLKVFNVDCKIFLHPAMSDRISFGMRIFPSYEEMKGQFLDALEEPKNGFKLINCNNVSIEIDGALLNYSKKNNRTARELTAILIHEIGHKVYVSVQRRLYSKEYDLQGNAEETKKGKLKYKNQSISIRINRAKFVRNILPNVNPIVAFSNMLMAFIGTSSIRDLISIKYYSEREIYSDSLAVSYGYGKEIYDVLIFLQKEANAKYVSRPKKIADWFEKNLNYYYLRRKGVIEFLKKEYEQAKSPLEKETIKKLLDDLMSEQNKDFDEDDSAGSLNEGLNEIIDYLNNN